MTKKYDVNYNFLEDNPNYDPTNIDFYYDPDKSSKNLQLFHQASWSKEEHNVKLDFACECDEYDTNCLVLINKYGAGEQKVFSSDWIANDYQYWNRNKYPGLKYLNNIDKKILKNFSNITNTIGGRIIFPRRKIDGPQSINQHRGKCNKISDRFDITLECIRRFYNGEESIPEFDETLQRYDFFFYLFGKSQEGFKNYCDFFLLHDLVLENYTKINFFLTFEKFEVNPFPKSEEEYLKFAKNVRSFVNDRNQRIEKFLERKNNQA